MKTITFHKKDVHRGKLILINKQYPLMSTEKEYNISMIPAYAGNPGVLLENKTASVLSHLIGVLRCDEEIMPVSGYRTYEEQLRIYSDSLAENGDEFTQKYVALPNHSEHQSGLAIDLALKQEKVDFIRPHFPYEGICKMFREKAPLYGFVERYQRGKEKITGIAHEPWHFRYVGYPHSVIMQRLGMALEEYTEYLKDYPYEGTHFITEVFKQSVEIFYVSADSGLASIELEDDIIYQTSGNNIDGFIVTVWR